MNPDEALWRDPPPPVRGAEPGTWAHHSIVARLPDIGHRTLEENDFPDDVRREIQRLIDQIPSGPIERISDPGAPDRASWDAYVEPHLGADWLQPPWFFIETYFYRRIVAAVRYFRPTAHSGSDPFHLQKQRGLSRAAAVVEGCLDLDDLEPLLLASLWANRADLSLWPAGSDQEQSQSDPASAAILADQRRAVLDHLNAQGQELERVDVLLDNVGAELAADLCLVDRLLHGRPQLQVVLHAKAHPTFVSDATIVDVEGTLHALRQDTPQPVRQIALRLQQALLEQRLLLKADLYWTSPLPGWQMPAGLRDNLSHASLIISKGDANYRRLLGDRHWPATTPIEEILTYSPAPLLLLRTLKSELAAGLAEADIRRAANQDPDWMTNGRWGLIQFVPRAP